MTSKEALDIIKNNKGISFCEAYKELLNIIEKDLDQLEKLEQENNSLRAFVSNLQFCREREAKELEKLEKKNQELRKAIKQWNINGGNLLKENNKLKQALEILKDKLELSIEKEFLEKDNFSITRYWLIMGKVPYATFTEITKEQYELLKEVLGNE